MKRMVLFTIAALQRVQICLLIIIVIIVKRRKKERNMFYYVLNEHKHKHKQPMIYDEMLLQQQQLHITY